MIQIYISKKNFDLQKAQRFFKERRIQVQELDLKKHRLGERELQTLSRAGGLSAGPIRYCLPGLSGACDPKGSKELLCFRFQTMYPNSTTSTTF